MKENGYRVFYGLSKRRRLQNLNGITKREDVLLEVVVRGEVVGENAMVAMCLDLFLADVEWKGAEVADLIAINLQDDLLTLHVVVLAYTI